MEIIMGKTTGLLAQLRRNDRILKAALSGALLYALTVAVAAPVLNAAVGGGSDQVVLRLRAALAPATLEHRVASPTTVVRDVVNRPAYQAYLREKDCLATAVYFEARSESAKGQRAVAEVVLARTRVPGRPRTICGVVYEGSHRRTGCQFSFTCDGIADRVRDRDAWRQAMRIATNVMRTGGKVNQVAGGATFYHADYVNPRWASRMVKVAEIGTHIFYRPQRGRHL
jgi:spore germination cell wall hydrolase CwlJ-like protein